MLSKPKLFTVHMKAQDSLENAIFVKEGFSFPAFLFGAFWAFYQRLWWPAILMLAVEIIFQGFFADPMEHPAAVIIHLGVLAIFGFLAPDLRQGNLRERGYVLTDVVAAENLLRAEQRFLDRYRPSH